MEKDYDVIINGVSFKNQGFLCVKRPSRDAPMKRYKVLNIKGLDGKLYQDTGLYEDMDLKISFNYKATKEKWQQKYREAIQIIYKAKTLQLSDDLGGFYKVKKVNIGTNTRESLKFGKFDVTFTIDPFFYIHNEKSKETTFINDYETAKPIFYIKHIGESDDGFLTVNDKKISFCFRHEWLPDVDTLVINTELQLSYYIKSKQPDWILGANTAITGDYEDVLFKNGKNTVSVSLGFEIETQVDWRDLG